MVGFGFSDFADLVKKVEGLNKVFHRPRFKDPLFVFGQFPLVEVFQLFLAEFDWAGFNTAFARFALFCRELLRSLDLHLETVGRCEFQISDFGFQILDFEIINSKF